MIKNLIPGLVERGKIKIGIKGEWKKSVHGKDFQLPLKLDHFVVTGALRGKDGNFVKDEAIHDVLGPAPIELPIFLLYNEIELNFQTRYACYTGARLFCFGDGEEGSYLIKDGGREKCVCPCNRQEPTYSGSDKCKIHGTLSVVLSGAEIIGGVWKFRTTSYNSVIQIFGSLAMIKRISGGYLAGLPLWLNLRPKSVSSPLDGRLQTVYVVGLEFRGNIDALQAAGYKRAITDKKHELQIKSIEDEAKRLISSKIVDATEIPADIQDEFHPDAAEAVGPDHPAGADAGAGGGPPPLKKPAPADGAGPGPGPQDQPPESQDKGGGAPGPENPAPPPRAAQAKRGRPAKKKTVKPAQAPQAPQDQGGGGPADPPADPQDQGGDAPPLSQPAGAAGPGTPAAPPATEKNQADQNLSLF